MSVRFRVNGQEITDRHIARLLNEVLFSGEPPQGHRDAIVDLTQRQYDRVVDVNEDGFVNDKDYFLLLNPRQNFHFGVSWINRVRQDVGHVSVTRTDFEGSIPVLRPLLSAFQTPK